MHRCTSPACWEEVYSGVLDVGELDMKAAPFRACVSAEQRVARRKGRVTSSGDRTV